MYICTASGDTASQALCPHAVVGEDQLLGSSPCRCRSTPSAAWCRPRVSRRSPRPAGPGRSDIFCRYDSRRSSTRVSSPSKSSSRCPPMRTGRSYCSTNGSSRAADAALPVEQPLPGAVSVGRQGGRHRDTGDDNVGETVPRSQPCHCCSERSFRPSARQYAPKARATLCPPKPNELLMAYWYSPYRGSPATTSRSISGSGVS